METNGYINMRNDLINMVLNAKKELYNIDFSYLLNDLRSLDSYYANYVGDEEQHFLNQLSSSSEEDEDEDNLEEKQQTHEEIKDE